jgi:hypothetical protein
MSQPPPRHRRAHASSPTALLPPVTRRTALRSGAVLGAATGATAVGLSLDTAGAVTTTTVTPRRADDLVESFGVCTHFNYQKSVYGQHDQVIDWLTRLGVRHVRSRLSPLRDVMDAFESLAGLGIQVDATCGMLGDPQTMDSLMKAVRTRFADPEAVFSAFEGINEPNNDGVPWVQETRRKTRELFKARAAHGLTGIPIIAPSLASVTSGGVEGGTTAGQAAQLGDLTDAIDYGNTHIYPRGLQPSKEIDFFNAAAREVCGNRPIVCTEGGYFNAMGYQGGAWPVPEDVAAAYAPQQILEHWNAGTKRFFRYELLDEPNPSSTDREGTFGMLNTGSTWTPKASFAPTRQLLRTFSDPGPAFTRVKLAMALTGGPSDLRSAVFAKRDGTHLIALWLDRPIYDPRQRTLLAPSLTAPVETVQLTLGSPRNVTVQRLTNLGWSATYSRLQSRQIDLTPGVTILTLT